MVSLVKMLVSTVTGKAPDDGVEGKLNVKAKSPAKKKSAAVKKVPSKKAVRNVKK